MNLVARLRCILHAAAFWKAMGKNFEKLWKLFIVAGAPPLRFAGETGHALCHISLKAHALLLSVVANIDSGSCLFLDDVLDAAIHGLCQKTFIDSFAFLAAHQQIRKL